MPPQHPKIPSAPQPTKIFFDPFNSSSTGHQRAENRLSGSTSWRDSRSFKLKHQFSDAAGGGGVQHLSDLVGAGSENYKKDGRKDNGSWEVGAPGLREGGWQDIRSLLGSKRKREDATGKDDNAKHADEINDAVGNGKKVKLDTGSELPRARREEIFNIPPIATVVSPSIPTPNDVHIDDGKEHDVERPPQIFRGLTMYLNGSTMPLVSDHRLKQLFARHGGNSSIALGRRTVTHVILGERCGGGLASGKIQKENTTIRGKGIKYVNVQWVLDSVEKGIRQPEHKYASTEIKGKLGGSGQKSVAGMFRANSA